MHDGRLLHLGGVGMNATMTAPVPEAAIRNYWDAYPCGHAQVEPLRADPEAFFCRYDAFRYSPRQEAHILKRLDAIDFRGKRVLEIGLGQGAESEQMIRRGAVWSGLDLTPESVRRVRSRLELRKLPYEQIACGSALRIPYPERSFDLVFSHGVLHHIPEILTAQWEIARVLRPEGQLIAVVYAKRSLNYWVSIALLRRLALAALYPLKLNLGGKSGQHLRQARISGLRNYLHMHNFIHKNTDGPLNPYSKVYDVAEVRKDFPAFEIERAYQDHMHAPPLPVKWMKPLAGVLGWHLWVHMRKAGRPQ